MITFAKIKQDHDMYLTYLCYPKGRVPLSDSNSLGRALFNALYNSVVRA